MFTEITENDLRTNLFREDVPQRLAQAVQSLTQLAQTRVGNPDEFARLTSKAAGVQLVINAHSERIKNVRDQDDIVSLIGFVNVMEGADEAEQMGIRLVHGYMCEYVR